MRSRAGDDGGPRPRLALPFLTIVQFDWRRQTPSEGRSGAAHGRQEELWQGETHRDAQNQGRRSGYAQRVLGKAKRAVKRKVKAAAAGAKKAAGKVERAMSPKKPGARRKTGAAKKAAGHKTTSAKSAVKKGMAKVKTTARKFGAAVTKAAKGAAK